MPCTVAERLLWYRRSPTARLGCSSHYMDVCGPLSPPTTRLLSKILSECEDADEIEYLVDGSWRPIRPEKERSSSPQCSILVLGESGPPPAPSSQHQANLA